MRLVALIASVFVLAFFATTTAQALSMTVGGPGCGSCDGSEITLEILENGGGFDVTLTLDSTGYDQSRTGLAQIGFGGIKDWKSVELVSAPTSQIAWASPVHGNVNSSSLCGNSKGKSGKVCTWGYTDIRDDDEYIWEFKVKGGKLKLDTDDWHIGGQYANRFTLAEAAASSPNGRIISESGSSAAPVPEPTAALVFAAGILVVSRRMRRDA